MLIEWELHPGRRPKTVCKDHLFEALKKWADFISADPIPDETDKTATNSHWARIMLAQFLEEALFSRDNTNPPPKD
jgi:hypothetical protein